MPVVDASVAVKWFVEESGSLEAHHLLDAHAAGIAPLVAPDLLVYEVANVLLHHPTIRTPEAQRHLERLYDLDLELIAPSIEAMSATVALASAKRITLYDAVYVQLAHHLELPFYTADQKLLSKFPDLPLVRGL